MPTYRTEYEAWQAVLDVLEGYGMPPYLYLGDIDYGDDCEGLCEVIGQLIRARAITERTADAMLDRVDSTAADWCDGLMAPPGEAKPRIPYVRKFMEECK